MRLHFRLARLALLAAAACATTPTLLPAQVGRPIGDAAYDSAFYAWERGAYPDALQRLQRLLTGPDAARYHAPAAELTGEVFATTELTVDGAAPRFSPDGRYIAYQTGARGAEVTQIVTVDGGRVQRGALLRGVGAAFDGTGRVAYIAGAPPRVIVRELASGRETTLPTAGINPQALYFRAGELAVYALAPTEGGGRDLYRLGAGAPARVTTAQGGKEAPVWLAGDRLLYTIDRQLFAIQNLRDGTVEQFTGASVSVSADGGTIAWLRQDGGRNVLTVQRAGTAARDVVRRSEAMLAPALSADGRHVAYQVMPREDWEVYVADVETGAETRLTREIQHDVLPRFAHGTHVLALMGEPRHRRSYLYDVATGTRTRLFHNNTVRTVAPEYDWVLSADGTKLLVVADRDGNTISPERGVYLLDLTRAVSLEDVRARVQQQLAHEQELRTRGAQLFAGIEEPVRDAVRDVSRDRAYRYSHDLHQFDSKYITRPGNAQAIEYLVAQLRGWGYDPEVQWFETRPRAAPGQTPQPVRTANVIAHLPGTVQPDVLYVVSSHFDSVERGPGSDDNTSGTAALLEAARVLATRPQQATIHFAFFTGEEAGLLGSREYVRRAVERGDRLVGALNNDMIGFANDQRLDNTIRYSNDGIRDIQHAAAFLFTDLITYDARYYRSTDAHAYYEAYGDIVGGIGSYPILGNPHYHQTHDQLETINHQLVAEVSKTTVATLMHLASSPSRPKNLEIVARNDGTLDLKWEALPERNLTGYSVRVIGANGQQKSSRSVPDAAARVHAVAPGDTIEVWGVGAAGRPGWDAARLVID